MYSSVVRHIYIIKSPGTSLAVQWLRIHASTAGPQVWSLVGELRFPHAMQCGQNHNNKANLQDFFIFKELKFCTY